MLTKQIVIGAKEGRTQLPTESLVGYHAARKEGRQWTFHHRGSLSQELGDHDHAPGEESPRLAWHASVGQRCSPYHGLIQLQSKDVAPAVHCQNQVPCSVVHNTGADIEEALWILRGVTQ